MAAPVTTGKYVSGLSGMSIDDYIKCVYEAPFDNVAGYFSQLGNKEPWVEVHTTTNGGAEVVSKEPYSELPTTPTANNISGFFYLIKVDNGMLIADRMVQQAISWESLNKKNYIYGGVFDTVNSRTVIYRDIQSRAYNSETDTTTTVTKYYNPDTNEEITAAQSQEFFNDYDKKILKYSVTSVDNTSAPTTITTKTDTIHYAYIPDTLPNRIQSAVIDSTKYSSVLTLDEEKNIYVISIPYNSEISAISNKLNTITDVVCTVLKDDGTTITQEVGVTWDYNLRDKDDKVTGPVYSPGTIGNVIIYGDLDDMDLDPINPAQNPNNIRASCVVMIQTDEIIAADTSSFSTLTVDTDTGAVALASQLASLYPSCSVTCRPYDSTDDSNDYTRNNVAIEWDVSNYTPGVVGTTTIVGELSGFEAYGLSNTAGTRVEIEVETIPVVSGS